MKTKAEAEQAGRKLVEMLDGDGWEVRLWPYDYGCGVFVDKGVVRVHAYRLSSENIEMEYEATLLGCVSASFFSDPNEAVRQCLNKARAHIAEIEAAIESVEPKEKREPPPPPPRIIKWRWWGRWQ